MSAPNPSQTILLMGTDARLGYLLERYAARSNYPIETRQTVLPAAEVEALSLAAIIFLSIELLETSQDFVAQLATRDIPIVACAAAADEARARELGADRCLLHPVTYDDFHTALSAMNGSKQH